MKKRALIIALILAGLGGVALWLRQVYGHDHMLRLSGQKDLANVSCLNCHLVSTASLRWSQPRPHHDAPAGLAVSPDGKKIYIALDDRDQVAEADTASLKVLRRARVAGRPFGLALDETGKSLFVTCREGDRLAVLDTQSLQESGSVPVGVAPVAVAFCRTVEGERLVVANSMSDDISVLSVSPLKELGRPAAGREPFAVSVTPDGVRAFVASRMVRLASVNTLPASDVTEVDPLTARVVRRDSLESAHLSEGVCAVPSKSWTLTPLVKVRNLVPIVQVANGWVMSSGLAVTDVKSGEVIQLPLDEANNYFADPSGIAVDPSGRRAFVASGGSDVVTVVDLERVAAWLEKACLTTRQEAIYDLTL
jgi:YVTN family beta-propeller protein